VRQVALVKMRADLKVVKIACSHVSLDAASL
jgi:hypothetical protein